jgi:hypothetical protein
VRDNFRKRRGWRSSENREWPDNALRHSFASCHLAHFKDAAVLALETGHTDSGMIFDHYPKLGKPRLPENWRRSNTGLAFARRAGISFYPTSRFLSDFC